MLLASIFLAFYTKKKLFRKIKKIEINKNNKIHNHKRLSDRVQPKVEYSVLSRIRTTPMSFSNDKNSKLNNLKPTK